MEKASSCGIPRVDHNVEKKNSEFDFKHRTAYNISFIKNDIVAGFIRWNQYVFTL